MQIPRTTSKTEHNDGLPHGVVYGNDFARKNLGIVPAVIMIGSWRKDTNPGDIYHPETVASVYAELASRIKSTGANPLRILSLHVYDTPARLINGVDDDQLHDPTSFWVAFQSALKAGHGYSADTAMMAVPRIDYGAEIDIWSQAPDVPDTYQDNRARMLHVGLAKKGAFYNDVSGCIPKRIQQSLDTDEKKMYACRYGIFELLEIWSSFSRGIRIKIGYERERKYDRIFKKILDDEYPELCSSNPHISGPGQILNPDKKSADEIWGTIYYNGKCYERPHRSPGQRFSNFVTGILGM